MNIERQAEVNGLEMGILSDGTPFLTGRALASLCGTHHSVIQDLTADWAEVIPKARVSAIRDILGSRGIAFEKPYVATQKNGKTVFENAEVASRHSIVDKGNAVVKLPPCLGERLRSSGR